MGKITGITLTGFASPRYRRKFVNPMSEDREAYEYNLKLSMARSQEIAKYIFGDDIGSYPYKAELKRLTSISGKGYMSPVLFVEGRIPANKSVRESCGAFDCAKSRRVEIGFVFRNRKEFLSQFEQINANRNGVSK